MVDWKNKKRIKLVSLNKGASMIFKHRLAYSCLLSHPAGLSRCTLASKTSMHKTHTAPKVLARLEEQGYVTRDGIRWVAVPSETISIDPSRKAETWYQRINYLKYYLPTKQNPLTPLQLAVYYEILCGKHSASLIGRLLCVRRQTVQKCIRKLKAVGLVDELGDATLDPPADWWQDKPALKAAAGLKCLEKWFSKMAASFADSKHDLGAYPWADIFKEFLKVMEEYKYSPKHTQEFLLKCFERVGYSELQIMRLCVRLTDIAHEAEKQTKANRSAGQFYGSSSYGLFKLKAKDRLLANLQRSA